MEENKITITAEQIQDIIEKSDIDFTDFPIEISIIPEGGARRDPDQIINGIPANKLNVMAAYSGELKLIEIYTEGVQNALDGLCICGTMFPSLIHKPIHRLVLSAVKHEMRHYYQHKWLEDKFGEKDGLEKFAMLAAAPSQLADLKKTCDTYGVNIIITQNPIMQDAMDYVLGKVNDLDEIMPKALDYLDKVKYSTLIQSN